MPRSTAPLRLATSPKLSSFCLSTSSKLSQLHPATLSRLSPLHSATSPKLSPLHLTTSSKLSPLYLSMSLKIITSPPPFLHLNTSAKSISTFRYKYFDGKKIRGKTFLVITQPLSFYSLVFVGFFSPLSTS